ncbi:MAG: transglycosylase SLT domain-containing protein [Calditrichaceae bacterium]|nr:transglycosylase SLT domain-containing protein [Calditrichaceae bacterium]MBN2709227.1 transglycosylase SLT domain-containing protein [Calditrichaceae bacterium]RQV96180.1 MAG: hypothetical protein EH224_05610 [Calditrichota bacterium]
MKIMRYLLFSLTGLALCAGCSERIPENLTAEQADSLKAVVERKIEEKKQIARMRIEFEESYMGKSLSRYKPIIKKYSKRYGFDWRLITAQIVQESGFKTEARSRVGAHGLMQLMPGTAHEISKELDIEYIMKNPRENITAGIYHLKKQYRMFPEAQYSDRIKLALASYNCGIGRIFDAQDISRYFKKPENVWINISPNLALLKKSDWQLHLQVWPIGKPPYGYFYGYNETINYVDNIWRLYEAYRVIL